MKLGSRQQQFILITGDTGLAELLLGLWPEEEVDWTVFERGRGAIERLFNEPPDLLIVDSAITDCDAAELVRLVKSENVYRQVPVLICLENERQEELFDFSRVELDDFLLRPVSPVEARARITLTVHRAVRELDANPLTKLPGNTSIINRIQDLIDRGLDFALLYADLDHFKSFNDKYGFSRGDEVLMMSARVIVNTIRAFVGADSFVGHVGGDDFVIILEPDKAEDACRRIVESFDSIVPHFYDPEDRRRGFISSTDRRGGVREFPFVAISLGVVFNEGGRLEHYGQASQIAMNMKKKAKEVTGSSYALDRRDAP